MENQKTSTEKPWTVLARRAIYNSDWVGLQLVDVRLPDSKVIHDIHVVTYPFQAAAVVPIGDDGKILLIDHYRFQTDTRGWEIPAGKIDAEETPGQAAAREMLEETGHRANVLKFLGRYHPSNGSSDQVFHVFVAHGVTHVGAIQDTNEVMGVRWFTPPEVRADRPERDPGWLVTHITVLGGDAGRTVKRIKERSVARVRRL